MPRIWKQVLSKGEFTVRCVPCGGTGQLADTECPLCAGSGCRTVEFTDDDCRNLHQTGKDMLAAGLQIPLPLEHQFGADPAAALAGSVAYNSGFVGDYALDQDGTLWAGLDVDMIPAVGDQPAVTDEVGIRHRLEKTIKYVSPSIVPGLRDGQGRSWDGIAHICLTPIPVWSGQKPFGAAMSGQGAVSMSRGGVGDWKQGAVALSLPWIHNKLERADMASGPHQGKRGGQYWVNDAGQKVYSPPGQPRQGSMVQGQGQQPTQRRQTTQAQPPAPQQQPPPPKPVVKGNIVQQPAAPAATKAQKPAFDPNGYKSIVPKEKQSAEHRQHLDHLIAHYKKGLVPKQFEGLHQKLQKRQAIAPKQMPGNPTTPGHAEAWVQGMMQKAYKRGHRNNADTHKAAHIALRVLKTGKTGKALAEHMNAMLAKHFPASEKAMSETDKGRHAQLSRVEMARRQQAALEGEGGLFGGGAAHAPAGYTHEHPLEIAGKDYVGGEFIPAKEVAKADPEQKQEIEEGVKDAGTEPAEEVDLPQEESTDAAPAEEQPAAESPGERAAAPGGSGEPDAGADDSGSAGRTAGQGGIVTAREHLTKPVDTGRVPESLREHLDEPQTQGVAKALDALDKHGGFVLADGTGVGKTRQELAVAKAHADAGKKVLIVSPAGVLKQDWVKGTVSGSWNDDAATMGVDLVLNRGDKPMASGDVHVTTYENLAKLKEQIDKNTTVLFDESHNLKNWGSARAKHGYEIGKAAGSVLYATATPADKPLHIAHLFRAKVFGNQSWDQTYSDMGMHKVRVNAPGSPKGYVEKWEIDPKVGAAETYRRMSGLFDKMTEEGLMVKREVSLDGIDVGIDHVDMPPEAHAEMQEIAGKYEPHQKGIIRMAQRMAQERYKVDHAVSSIKRELAEGRQVVLFGASVNATGEEDDEGGGLNEGTMTRLRDKLKAEGIEFGELHGGVSKGAQKKAMEGFQAGKHKVMIGTVQSGGVGINLDDRHGDKPRTLLMMTPPFSAVDNIQAAGRVHRRTTKSQSRIRYLLADTPIDRWNANLIAGKMKTLGATVGGSVAQLDIPSDEAEDIDPHERASQLIQEKGPHQWRSLTGRSAPASQGAASQGAASQGAAAPASRPSGGMTRFPFGKHKGARLADIPRDYLQWAVDNMDALRSEQKSAIREHLAGKQPPARSETPAPTPQAASRPTSDKVTVSGNTFAHKDRIKAAGGRWDADRKVWTVPAHAADKLRSLSGLRLMSLARWGVLQFSRAMKPLGLIVPEDCRTVHEAVRCALVSGRAIQMSRGLFDESDLTRPAPTGDPGSQTKTANLSHGAGNMPLDPKAKKKPKEDDQASGSPASDADADLGGDEFDDADLDMDADAGSSEPGAAEPRNDQALIAQLASVLEGEGMVVPSAGEMDLEEYVRHIITSVATKKHHESKDGAGTDDPNGGNMSDTNSTAGAGQPEPNQFTMMSLQRENKALQSRLNVVEIDLADRRMTEVFNDLQLAEQAGLMDKAEADANRAKLQEKKLSLARPGDVEIQSIVTVAKKLGAAGRKQLAAQGLLTNHIDMSRAQAVARPDGQFGKAEMTDEKANECADEILGKKRK